MRKKLSRSINLTAKKGFHVHNIVKNHYIKRETDEHPSTYAQCLVHVRLVNGAIKNIIGACMNRCVCIFLLEYYKIIVCNMEIMLLWSKNVDYSSNLQLNQSKINEISQIFKIKYVFFRNNVLIAQTNFKLICSINNCMLIII